MKRVVAVLVSTVVVGTGVMGVPASRAGAETPSEDTEILEPIMMFPQWEASAGCATPPPIQPECVEVLPWSFAVPGSGSWGIGAEEAWAQGVTGDGVVVAVLDSGTLDHPDLGTQLAGYDFVTSVTAARDGDGRDATPRDQGLASGSVWHGVHVAGTIRGIGDSLGVKGVAFGAALLPVRVLGNGGGSSCDVIAGIRWAAGVGPDVAGDQGLYCGPTDANNGWFGAAPTFQLDPDKRADVINLSLGGSGACDFPTQRAIDDAVAAGVVVVAAAGNSNSDASGFSPANCNGVITVSATDWTGKKAVWSSGGVTGGPNWGSRVDLAAPGVAILSTWNPSGNSPSSYLSTARASDFAFLTGTSMATPHVAGAVALMRDANPALTPAQVETILVQTAYAFASTPSNPIGAGILNAQAAVEASLGAVSTTPVAPGTTPAPTPSPSPNLVPAPAPAPVPVVVAPSAVASAWRSGKARSVTVKWTPPASTGNSALTGYVVTSNANKSWRTSADARELRFDSLVRGKEYRFSVAADNGSFVGPATWTSWIRVPILRRSSTLLSVIIPAPKGSTKRVYSASGKCRKSGKFVKASSSKGTCKVTLRYRLNGKTQTLRASIAVQ